MELYEQSELTMRESVITTVFVELPFTGAWTTINNSTRDN